MGPRSVGAIPVQKLGVTLKPSHESSEVTTMLKLRRALPLAGALAALAAFPAGAGALPIDLNGFHLQSALMTVDQTAGQAVVTVQRDDTSKQAWVRYETVPGSAVRGQDYTPV